MSRLSGPLRTRIRRRVTRLGHLRACLPAAVATAAVCGLIGWLTAGRGTGLGTALGVAVAATSFTFGVLCVDAADRVATRLVLPVGLAAYGLTVLGLGVVVVRADGDGGPVLEGLPWGVVAGTLMWVGVQSWWAWTSPTPYVEP